MVAQKFRSKDLYFLDLFAGSGGFTLGLETAGFNSLGSIEINPAAQRTLQLNFGETPLNSIQIAGGDVTKVDVSQLKQDLLAVGIPELDLLVACPPCQGFSTIGRGKLDFLAGSKGSHPDDPRNKLYNCVIEYLSVLKPRAFVFENVPGMLSVGGQNIAELMCRGAESKGYQVKTTLLNAAWFGVPQLRERIIMIGFRNDLGSIPTFPAIKFNGPETEGQMSASDRSMELWKCKKYFVQYSELKRSKEIRPFRSVEEALCDLPEFRKHLHALNSQRPYKSVRTYHESVPYKPETPNEYCSLMRNWSGFQTDHVVTDHFCRWTPRDFSIFRRMKEGDTYPEALILAKQLYEIAKKKDPSVRRVNYIPPYPDNSFKDKWRKLLRKKPSWTVTAHLSKDTYSHIHYDSSQARAITLREAARLQSFPDGFKFHGNTGDMYRQIGNAVPPLLAKEIGLSLAKQLVSVETSLHTRETTRLKKSWEQDGPQAWG